ncbi:hypothetical protein [Ancylobacter terrae]|uniref:hypothetical protein n=1 Tax=Ancylobacter sp. sgz301288 TaxID=3342077 RepID=UPI003859030A
MDDNVLRDLLIQRLALVGDMARLNAAQLQIRQLLGGRELALALAERDGGEGADAALALARDAVAEVAARLAAGEAELDGLGARLDAIDARIAVLNAPSGGDRSVQSGGR